MRKLRITLTLSMLLVLFIATSAQGQIANNTPFFTAITYQNIGTAATDVNFLYYNENSSSSIALTRTLNPGGADSFFVGSLSTLPTGFNGTAVVSADQPLIATIVQIPDSNQGGASPVRNRGMSNAYRSGAPKLYLVLVAKQRIKPGRLLYRIKVSRG